MKKILDDTRQMMYDIFAHHNAENHRINRAVQALGYGLDPAEYARPFPGSNTTFNITPPPQSNGNHTWLKVALFTLAAVFLLFLTVGLTALALAFLWRNPAAATPPPAAAPVPSAETKVGAVELEVKWRQDDQGEWRTDVKQVPPGK
jgi:hypothetical protein